MIAGVAGGLGERFGIDPVLVRIAFLLLAFGGGSGVILYLLAWAVSSEEGAGEELARTFRSPDLQQGVALGLIVFGVLLLLRSVGLWFGDSLVWPVAIGALGSAVIWTRGDESDRERWTQMGSRITGNPVDAVFGGRISVPRILVGAVLIAAGMAAFLASNTAFAAIGTIALAVAVSVVGIGLVFGPWLVRLWQQLSAERIERIRSEERAELAAHLHDSVLQTLALIQRSADQPRRVTTLARRQERELRAWLYRATAPGGVGADGNGYAAAATITGAVDAMIEDVEAVHQTDVEPVVVGDGPVDDDVLTVIAALREACVNASKHAGVDVISLYLESGPDAIHASVLDRGAGFDPDAVPADRRGIADSIRGRIERRGGEVRVITAPGEGTEVTLSLPRDRNGRDRTDDPTDVPEPHL